MNAERWQKIEEVFQSALDLAPAEREAFISKQCGDDAELKQEVEQLLADYVSADSFIESPAWTKNQLINSTEAADDLKDSFSNFLKENPLDPMINRQIGVYRLTKEIGRGGMGAVYLAERSDGSFRQRVAIKLIKRGMDTDFILRRFRQERQILATLNHPFIAQLLDGGTTDDDLPYFVMEFIEGEPIYKYSDRKKLTINERLKLFRQICEALDFAHQNQIIHRDIKPPNILVNNGGTPKLLDFGIAKVLNPEFGIDTIDPTLTAMRLMTPEYASPEQVCGSPVTPASDIYSLGVLLYELLTGHRPYRFRNRAAHEIARVICEEAPMRPSTGITREENLLPTGGNEATTLAQIYSSRGAPNIEALQKEIAGDLEKIILKCLRKEAGERYQTAAELAADINRYLKGEPIAAETRFFAAAPPVADKKNEAKSLAVLPLKILNLASHADTGEDFLSIGLADALISRFSGIKRLIVRPTSSVLRLKSEDPFAAGRELGVDFIVNGNIRRVGDRIRVTAQLLNVRENSTNWSESFDEKFTDVLELEDSLSEKVVKSLIPRLTGEEEKLLNKRGTNNADAYEAFLRGRANWNLQSEEGFARAVKFYQRAIELDPNYAVAHTAIAEYYIFLGIHCVVPFAVYAESAKKLIEKAIRLDSSLAAPRAMLGFLELAYNWNWTAAETHLREALKLNPNSATAHNWLSTVLLQTGRFDDALREVERVRELDPDSILSWHMQAWTLYQSRRFNESILAHQKLLETEPNYAWGLQTYSWALRRVGRFEEAVAPAERSVKLTGENPFYLTSLASAYAEAGQRGEAETILERLAEISKTRFVSEYMLALVYCALGDKDHAFANLEKSFNARDGWLNWLPVESQFDVLKDDERYEDLLRRAGNPLAKPKAKKSAAAISDGEKSIAVLPLKLFGAPTGSDDQYLGIGLADALVTRLSNVRRLVVRPTSSVLAFDNSQAEPFAAGRELGVDFVLDGNVRRVGERIRVTLQLLSVSDNSSCWAAKFDERLTDVLALEDSISEKVAKSLLPHLTGEEEKRLSKRGTNSPQAYEAYLRGRYHLNLFTPGNFAKAKSYLEQAIGLDSNYALAYAGLADYYFVLGTFAAVPPLECQRNARRLAERAIEIDDTLGEAYTILGFAYYADYDVKNIEKNLRRGIELNPNHSLGRIWYSVFLNSQGKSEEAIAEAKKAAELNPLSCFDQQHYAWILYQNKRFDEAIERTRRTIDNDSNFSHSLGVYGWILRRAGRTEESLAAAKRAVELSPESPWLMCSLAASYVQSGEIETARKLLRELENSPTEKYVSPFCLAIVYCYLGDKERAFALLEKALATRDIWLLWISSDAQIEPLRSDKRYHDLLRRMGNPLAEPEDIKEQIRIEPLNTFSEKSIAVLPLKIIGETKSEDTGDEYLAVGLADALITRLSNVRRFIVRPTSSVLPYGKKQIDSFAAGRELKVDFIVDGSIRRVGERIRVTAQLLSINDNATRWAQSFDENFSDVLTVEDSISEQVAKSLLPQLTGEEERQIKKRGTDNSEAFEAYLRGRHYWNTFTEEGFAKALIFYNQAISIAPDYAVAYAGIADYYNLLGIYAVLPFQETSAAAKEAALKALALDDFLAEAHAALGFAVLMLDFDWAQAEKHLSRAVKLNPNYVTGRIWYSYFLGLKGEFDESLRHAERALELDPLTPVVSHTFNLSLYYARRFDESIASTEKFVEREPRYGLSQLFLSSALWRVGRTAEAVSVINRAVLLLGKTPYTLIWLASAYAADGQTEKAKELISEVEEISLHRYVSPYLLAMAYINLNDAEKAVELLEQAWDIRDGRLVWLGVDPQFDALRDLPRFKKVLRLTNNPYEIRSEAK